MFESLYSTFTQSILLGRLSPDFSKCSWVFQFNFHFSLSFQSSFQLEFASIFVFLLGWLFKILSLSFDSALCSCFIGHHSGFLQLSGRTPSLKDIKAITAAEVTEGCCLLTWSVCFPVNPTCPGVAESTVTWALPNQSLIKKFSHRLAYSQSWWRHFSIKISPPQICLCCVKLTKTNQDLLQCPMCDRE